MLHFIFFKLCKSTKYKKMLYKNKYDLLDLFYFPKKIFRHLCIKNILKIVTKIPRKIHTNRSIIYRTTIDNQRERKNNNNNK